MGEGEGRRRVSEEKLRCRPGVLGDKAGLESQLE